jgi:hypothetical protein
MNEAIKRLLDERAVDGRIACADAQDIAMELGLEPLAVGEAATALGIRITGCQLGCF